ncbi:MAG TPA: C2 family cysteine protease [Vicinamibacteria bacterium]|nr:C2 family cysteine protease [Vicinamibacteria bacterium]
MSNVCPAPLPRLEDLFSEYLEAQRSRRATEALKRAEAARDLTIRGAQEGTAVHPSDVVQGQHVNCFLMASMSAVVQQHPDPDGWLRDKVKVNADGTYTVTFHDRQKDGSYLPREVTVTGEFSKPATSDEKGEKWPAVIEKAYAQAYGSPTDTPYGFGSGGGLATEAMERLTGKPSSYTPLASMSLGTLAQHQFAGNAITVATHPTVSGPPAPGPVAGDPLPGYSGNDYTGRPDLGHPDLSPWHVYYVSAVDPGTGMIKVHNVWDGGRKDIDMPFEDFQRSFAGVHVNPVK